MWHAEPVTLSVGCAPIVGRPYLSWAGRVGAGDGVVFQDMRMACLKDIGMGWRQRIGMSMARLVITAITVEGLSQGQAGRRYGRGRMIVVAL